MIDTNKLLSNRSGGSTTLSKKSVVNIGLIREDVIKIDSMLKSRLVLSKVREGIERQNQERLRRKSRRIYLKKMMIKMMMTLTGQIQDQRKVVVDYLDF